MAAILSQPQCHNVVLPGEIECYTPSVEVTSNFTIGQTVVKKILLGIFKDDNAHLKLFLAAQQHAQN